ncbi:hypothetical protein M899_1661 [Bacteriovorax sp. BSW11_IV]|uniref:hypothetical protein n=1 Tax=Bacteriovorax sp. BSW11_IV TaxID=1353529 RepID=UPI00038A1E1B|nr:hypothetical protein [Bacteriovorax sp. BSW11_IV]EQC49456.1 hypothetical protein M899_1661 [Bacteriovorax sp. BSW11_IV]
MTEPKCMKCKHYQVTFDPKAPRGCKIYGFRGPHMPSAVVKRETGQECQAYEPRIVKQGPKELDLNSDDLW